MEPLNLNFYEFLKSKSEQYPDAPALACDGHEITFSGLRQRAEASAALLTKMGVGPGKRVVIWGFNCIEWVVGFYAVTIAGGTAVLMNYGITPDEAAALSVMAEASFLLAGTTRASLSDKDAERKMAHAAGIDEGNIITFDELAESWTKTDASGFVPAGMSATDTQVIIFTTGTTCAPKAVCLSAYSIINDAHGAFCVLESGLLDTVLNALPLFHCYGLVVLHVYLGCGRRTLLSPSLKPDVVADLIHGRKIMDMASVGAVYTMLSRLPDFEERVRGRLNVCIVGGGFTSPAEIIRLEGIFGGAHILCGYGQTECSPVISVEVCDDPLEQRAVSVGHILPGIDVRIWRSGSGFLPDGEEGEIVVKGYCTMNGYYGAAPEETPFDENGYLHTGDIGRFTDTGMLQLTGRLKDVIIRGGENISPCEIEKCLLMTGMVSEAKVIGIPHPVWGESAEACVVASGPAGSKEAEQALINELYSALRGELSTYKLPSHIFVYDEFPLSAAGKPDLQTLRDDVTKKLS